MSENGGFPPMTTTTIDPALDLFEEIERLKTERKAVILAHYYQDPDIQDIADHLGDSLDLARKARRRTTARSSCSAASTSWPRPRRS